MDSWIPAIFGLIGAILGAVALFAVGLLNDRRTKQIAEAEKAAAEKADEAKRIATEKAEDSRVTVAQIKARTDDAAAAMHTQQAVIETQDRRLAAQDQRIDVLEERVARCESEKSDLRVALAEMRAELAVLKETHGTSRPSSDP